MAELPRLGVVICTRDRREALLRCLEALAGQDYPAGSTEIWIYDDAGADGSAGAAEAALARLRAAGLAGGGVIRGAGRAGIAAGRNAAAGRAAERCALLVFLDDDVLPAPGCLRGLAEKLLSTPGAGLAAPLVLRSDDGRPLHAPYYVNRFTFSYGAGDPRGETFCDWLDPACLMVRAEVFASVGGFWPGYFRSHEGVDLCLSAARAGHRALYYPAVSATHLMRPETLSSERLYYLYRNKLTLIRRHGGVFHRRLLLPALAAFIVLRQAALRLLPGSPPGAVSAAAAAARDGLAGREGARER